MWRTYIVAFRCVPLWPMFSNPCTRLIHFASHSASTLSQTKLGITSQFLINSFTAVPDDLVCFSLVWLPSINASKASQCHSYT
jgi:hypothetical protein